MNYTQCDTIDKLLKETMHQIWRAADEEHPIATRAKAAENAIMLLEHALSEAKLGAEKFYHADGTLREQARP